MAAPDSRLKTPALPAEALAKAGLPPYLYPMAIDIFTLNPHLENDRILLRPLEKTDYDHLLPFSLQEPDLWTYGLVTAAGPENLRRYINTAVDNRGAGTEFAFIVYDKQAGAYAGSSRFYDIRQEWKTTQLGYTWYGKAFQRSGLNRHCKLLLLEFAFETWGLERVEFRADAKNEASIAAMRAIGCVEEGILRNHMPNATGGRRDSIVFSILRPEWFRSVRAELLAKTR